MRIKEEDVHVITSLNEVQQGRIDALRKRCGDNSVVRLWENRIVVA